MTTDLHPSIDRHFARMGSPEANARIEEIKLTLDARHDIVRRFCRGTSLVGGMYSAFFSRHDAAICAAALLEGALTGISIDRPDRRWLVTGFVSEAE